MKKLHIDCTNGISSDMVFNALKALGADRTYINKEIEKLKLEEAQNCDRNHDHDHHSDHSDHSHHSCNLDHIHHEHHDHHHNNSHHHRSHKDIQLLIGDASLEPKVAKTALAIYKVIAKAEAQVHDSTIENVHFHEVGRKHAVENIVGIAAAIDSLEIGAVFCSEIHDGHGFIECSHGKIPVPVPAVAAMKEQCDYIFVTDDVDTEMVTPSGLGVLIGIGAQCQKNMPTGRAIAVGSAKGSRDIGRTEGLKITLLED